jgi:hypothetical protein
MAKLIGIVALAVTTLMASAGTADAALIGTLDRLSPLPQSFILGVDFQPMTGSALGTVTATLWPVDTQLSLGNSSTSGCEAADFAGFPATTIALLQRGGCNFDVKALNAQAAGARGVLIFNQGNVNDSARMDLFLGTVVGASGLTIPVMSLSYPVGFDLAVNTFHPTITMSVTESTDPPSLPEPASTSLLALGLATLVARRFRSK